MTKSTIFQVTVVAGVVGMAVAVPCRCVERSTKKRKSAMDGLMERTASVNPFGRPEGDVATNIPSWMWAMLCLTRVHWCV